MKEKYFLDAIMTLTTQFITQQYPYVQRTKKCNILSTNGTVPLTCSSNIIVGLGEEPMKTL